MEWISVDDQRPKEYQRVKVYHAGFGKEMTGHFNPADNGMWWLDDLGAAPLWRARLWQPLPARRAAAVPD